MPSRVEIVAADPDWPAHFARIAADLRSLIGGSIITIDHIGSTAVPGMPAKPVIDIDVTVGTLEDIAAAGEALVATGYAPRGNRHDDGMWAFLDASATPGVRVYLFRPGNRTHQRRLVFRDRMRADPVAARAYAELKQALARAFPYDGDRYTQEKRVFIDAVVDGAAPPAD
ncbi:GrpB family protein [Ensifer soli]|uniref:GrpB family protein n=1 Tax=Ciceribacter sp. sgz301302 TaxID=3342379 RepID=UPI0035B7E2BA